MVFSLTATIYRLQEGADGTSINTNHLACTWRVKMKGEKSIKEREALREGNQNQERNTVAIKNQTCNQTCEKYLRIDLLGLCR